jgi:hypothetical protein
VRRNALQESWLEWKAGSLNRLGRQWGAPRGVSLPPGSVVDIIEVTLMPPPDGFRHDQGLGVTMAFAVSAVSHLRISHSMKNNLERFVSVTENVADAHGNRRYSRRGIGHDQRDSFKELLWKTVDHTGDSDTPKK